MIFQQMRLNTALVFPPQNLVAILLPDSFECLFDPRQSLAILFVLFGNPLRALFLKNRDFFCYGEIFVPNTRGPLGCLLGFWPSGPGAWGEGGGQKEPLRRSSVSNNISFRLTHCLVGSQLRETRLFARVNLICTFQSPSKFFMQ